MCDHGAVYLSVKSTGKLKSKRTRSTVSKSPEKSTDFVVTGTLLDLKCVQERRRTSIFGVEVEVPRKISREKKNIPEEVVGVCITQRRHKSDETGSRYNLISYNIKVLDEFTTRKKDN